MESDKAMTLAAGIGIGAGLMYLLDPDRGSRRRALVRDQLVHGANTTGDALGTAARDLGNRARGLAAETRSRFRHEPVTDETLVARVRSELGRVVSHPGALIVTAHDGRVTVSGPILASESDRALSCIRSVHGVESVDDRLEAHRTAGDVPALQGGRQARRESVLAEPWTPAARLLVGAAGTALLAAAAKSRGSAGAALGLAGLGLLTRASTDRDLRQLVGIGARGIRVQKTINIAAPVGLVYAFWRDFRNFPHFMSHVREVRELGNGRSHWVVGGPAGVPVEWDAVISQDEPDRLIAWHTVPGSTVNSAGQVRFDETADGMTRVTVQLSYTPPAGMLGDVVATLFGANPKQEMDDDLLRMKTFIETGNPPDDAAQPSTEREPAAGGGPGW